MGREDDIKAFKDAKSKQDAYVAGLPKGSPETAKYLEWDPEDQRSIGEVALYRR